MAVVHPVPHFDLPRFNDHHKKVHTEPHRDRYAAVRIVRGQDCHRRETMEPHVALARLPLVCGLLEDCVPRLLHRSLLILLPSVLDDLLHPVLIVLLIMMLNFLIRLVCFQIVVFAKLLA